MKNYKAPIVVILVFVMQTILHYFVAQQLEVAPDLFFRIYGFLFFVILSAILIIELSHIAFKEQLGFIFLAIIVFKFVAGLLFLKMADLNHSPIKYHFLIAYLLLIFVLVFYVAEKLLNTDKKH